MLYPGEQIGLAGEDRSDGHLVKVYAESVTFIVHLETDVMYKMETPDQLVEVIKLIKILFLGRYGPSNGSWLVGNRLLEDT